MCVAISYRGEYNTNRINEFIGLHKLPFVMVVVAGVEETQTDLKVFFRYGCTNERGVAAVLKAIQEIEGGDVEPKLLIRDFS